MDIKEGFNSKKLVINVKQRKKFEADECNTSTNCNPKAKISLIGIRRQKSGRYAAVITDRIRHKKVWLGTFDTVEEASQAYFSKKSEFENEKLRQQGKKKSKRIRELTRIYNSEKSEELVNVKKGNENANCEIFQTESAGGSEIDVPISNSSNGGTERRIDSHAIGTVEEAFRIVKEGSRVFNSGLMANVCGTKSSDECNTTARCDPKVEISLIGVRKRKSGRYAAVITDPIKHKEVSLGTFDTVEQASYAYSSKKSEFEKLRQQGNKENKPKKNCDQIQQPESSHECNTTTRCDPKVKISLIGVRKRRSGRYAAVITDPIKHKEVSLGTFDTVEEASHAYLSKKSEFEKLRQQGNKENKPKKNCDQIQQPESSHECNITTSYDPKARRSSIGIRRRKSGRYAAVITDPIKHKEVSLGTFDTVEEASHAYLSKKSEFQKLRQQGNKENKPKKNCDQIQQPESLSVVASLDTTASESGRAKRIDSHKTTTRLIGAHKSKTTGRYTSEIINPITKRKIWLGTFVTAEEASRAYQSKKLEFQKLVESKQQQCTNKQRKSEKLVNVKQGLENVNCELKSSGRSPEIDVSFPNSFNGGTIQSIDSDKIGTAEEAFHAYQSNKFNLQSSKKVMLQSNMPTDSSAGEKQDGQEDDKDLWMGEWVQLPGNDRAVMFSLKLGLPIIDNYGSLLGEFTSLDDLSIS